MIDLNQFEDEEFITHSHSLKIKRLNKLGKNGELSACDYCYNHKCADGHRKPPKSWKEYRSNQWRT